ncbi:unnamed protein product, partial [Heterotrigona itama]
SVRTISETKEREETFALRSSQLDIVSQTSKFTVHRPTFTTWRDKVLQTLTFAKPITNYQVSPRGGDYARDPPRGLQYIAQYIPSIRTIIQQFAAVPPHSRYKDTYVELGKTKLGIPRLVSSLPSFVVAIATLSARRWSRTSKFRSRCAESRFEHLDASSLALPPTTQRGSAEPPSRITKDARLRESHPAVSDEAAVPRFGTLATKPVGDPTPAQRQKQKRTKEERRRGIRNLVPSSINACLRRTRLQRIYRGRLKLSRRTHPTMSLALFRRVDAHTTDVQSATSLRRTTQG